MDLEQLLACKKAGFPVVQYLGFVEHELRRVDIKRMDLGWLVFSDGFYFGAIDRFLKRAFDLAVSLTMLIATAPLVLFGILAHTPGTQRAGVLSAGTGHLGRQCVSDPETADDACRRRGGRCGLGCQG